VLEEVAGWEEELKEHYGQFLKGEELRMVRDATSSVRMLK
jgi:serine/threonine-protein kinase HipA